MTIRFSNKLVAELFQPFWAARQAGEFLTDAAAVAGNSSASRAGVAAPAGGVRPRRGRDLQGRYLSFAEREEIALARPGVSRCGTIAARLGRARRRSRGSWRRNADRTGRYRASSAHALAYAAGRRGRSRRSW